MVWLSPLVDAPVDGRKPTSVELSAPRFPRDYGLSAQPKVQLPNWASASPTSSLAGSRA